MTRIFEKPLRATRHCRYYSYEPGLQGGPRCAVGCDLTVPTSMRACMPEPNASCTLRVDYTDDERAAWEASRGLGMGRLAAAVQALPHPIPLRTSGTIDCPNCDGGTLRYARWLRGAEIQCNTPSCCDAHFSIAAGADWPVRA